MQLNSDITTEDLEVFLLETEEQLQTLDEDIVRLEQEGSDPELLSEIFRAAHTSVGSNILRLEVQANTGMRILPLQELKRIA